MSIKRVAMYIRVSSDKQAQEGDSIPAQRDALQKYIADHGDMVSAGEYLDDGISGTKYSQRDELQRLLDDVTAGKIDLIIFVKLDRFFRSIRWYTKAQEILDKHNVGWVAIWEPIYDTTTPQGRLIVNQMMSIAQFEAEQTGQRIRQVNAYKVTQGEVLSGTPPHGYKIVNKHLVPNETAENVVTVFQTFERTSSISKTLRETAGLKDVPRTHHNMKRTLKNEVYIGMYRGNENFCPPLIDRQLWDHVQTLLSRNIKQSQKHTYIFSGLVRCAECGCSMVAYTSRIKSRQYVTIHKRYRCSKRYLCKPAACQNKKTLGENQLEKYLVDNIGELVGKVYIDYEERKKKADGKAAKIAALEEKIERLKTLYVEGLIDIEEYKHDKALYLGRIADLSADVDKPPRLDQNTLKSLNGADFRDVYASLSREERRRFWRGIIKEIRFGLDKRIEVDFL